MIELKDAINKLAEENRNHLKRVHELKDCLFELAKITDHQLRLNRILEEISKIDPIPAAETLVRLAQLREATDKFVLKDTK